MALLAVFLGANVPLRTEEPTKKEDRGDFVEWTKHKVFTSPQETNAFNAFFWKLRKPHPAEFKDLKKSFHEAWGKPGELATVRKAVRAFVRKYAPGTISEKEEHVEPLAPEKEPLQTTDPKREAFETALEKVKESVDLKADGPKAVAEWFQRALESSDPANPSGAKTILELFETFAGAFPGNKDAVQGLVQRVRDVKDGKTKAAMAGLMKKRLLSSLTKYAGGEVPSFKIGGDSFERLKGIATGLKTDDTGTLDQGYEQSKQHLTATVKKEPMNPVNVLAVPKIGSEKVVTPKDKSEEQARAEEEKAKEQGAKSTGKGLLVGALVGAGVGLLLAPFLGPLGFLGALIIGAAVGSMTGR